MVYLWNHHARLTYSVDDDDFIFHYLEGSQGSGAHLVGPCYTVDTVLREHSAMGKWTSNSGVNIYMERKKYGVKMMKIIINKMINIIIIMITYTYKLIQEFSFHNNSSDENNNK